MERSLCLPLLEVALTGPLWPSRLPRAGSQLLWDALLLVACEEEAEEKWLDTHILQDFPRGPQARICS